MEERRLPAGEEAHPQSPPQEPTLGGSLSPGFPPFAAASLTRGRSADGLGWQRSCDLMVIKHFGKIKYSGRTKPGTGSAALLSGGDSTRHSGRQIKAHLFYAGHHLENCFFPSLLGKIPSFPRGELLALREPFILIRSK